MTTPLSEQIIGTEFVLRPTEYLYHWQIASMILLLFLVSLSLCINMLNKHVQLIGLFIIIDLLVHFFLCYGMNEAIIFGGNWMFVVPLLLGWLYIKLPLKLHGVLDWILVCIIALTIIYNGMEFTRVWNLIS